MTRTFTKEFLEDELDLLGPASKRIEMNVLGCTKGVTMYEIIFEFEGKIWQVFWDGDGDGYFSSWDYEENGIVATEVVKGTTEVEDWIPV
jgi:hypothetical protein